MKSASILIFLVVAVAAVNAKPKSDVPTTTNSLSSEEMFRLYEKAKKEVDELNKKYPTATFAINKFSFMSEAEKKKYRSPLPSLQKPFQFITFDDDNLTAPDSYNFLDDGFVTPVKAQLQCGSCYAFAATAAVESQYLIHRNKELDLSEEYVLECDAVDYECEGGYPSHALDVYKTSGVPLNECVPYTHENGTCPDVECDKYTIDGYKSFGTDESKFPALLYNYGPAAMIFNTGDAFDNYESGVLDLTPEECGSDGHVVLLIGYTEDYWIAKNSWGTDKGENGFFRFKRGTNWCNFATFNPVVPILSNTAATTTTASP